MAKRHAYVWATIAPLLTIVACSGGPEKPAGGAAPATAPRSAYDPAKATATVTAKTTYEGPKQAPQKIQMASDPFCASHADDAVMHTIDVNGDGTLADVIVFVKSGLPRGMTYPDSTETITIDQKGCQYSPRIFTMMAGQPLKIRNDDATLHNIHAWAERNEPFNFGQPVAGLEQIKTFERPEMPVPIKCDVHSWMQAYAGVFDHPFHGVTRNAGTVEMKLMPGKYEIEAWHPKFAPITQTVEVADNGKADVVFAFKEPLQGAAPTSTAQAGDKGKADKVEELFRAY